MIISWDAFDRFIKDIITDGNKDGVYKKYFVYDLSEFYHKNKSEEIDSGVYEITTERFRTYNNFDFTCRHQLIFDFKLYTITFKFLYCYFGSLDLGEIKYHSIYDYSKNMNMSKKFKDIPDMCKYISSLNLEMEALKKFFNYQSSPELTKTLYKNFKLYNKF